MTMGSHQRIVGVDQSRFTPRYIWEPLGGFDTDAATGAQRPWNIGTERNITEQQNCLTMDWRKHGIERPWLNPPFDTRIVGQFISKIIEHGRGVLLLHVRTDTRWFRPLFDHASAKLWLAGRVVFRDVHGNPCTITKRKSKYFGKVANSGAPVVLWAFGFADADVLEQFDCRYIPEPKRGEPVLRGIFEPQHFARFVLIGALENDQAAKSWRAVVAEWLRSNDGPVPVADLYRAFQHHPKAKRNPNWKAKVRQTLQRGAGRSVGRDQWIPA
jgi:hypothetical protein